MNKKRNQKRQRIDKETEKYRQLPKGSECSHVCHNFCCSNHKQSRKKMVGADHIGAELRCRYRNLGVDAYLRVKVNTRTGEKKNTY